MALNYVPLWRDPAGNTLFFLAPKFRFDTRAEADAAVPRERSYMAPLGLAFAGVQEIDMGEGGPALRFVRALLGRAGWCAVICGPEFDKHFPSPGREASDRENGRAEKGTDTAQPAPSRSAAKRMHNL